jgi:hypothetical protein
MPFDGDTLRLIPWTGGLNTVSNPAMTDPQQLTVAENIELTFDGSREKRGGVKKYNQIPVIDVE